jgi:hypothetical protein
MFGRVMDQAVSHWTLTMEARVHDRFNPCQIYGGQSGTGTVFFPEFFGFSLPYYSTRAPYSCIIWEMNNRLVGGHSSEI